MSRSSRAATALVATWTAYALLLFFSFRQTPFALLLMVVPLALTGWYARHWAVTATVGLGHGAIVAAIGTWVGAFGDAQPALMVALVLLLSWFAALSGWTLRIVQLLRGRTDELGAARRELEANAATVEAVYSASAVALVSLDDTGAIRSWNPGAEAIFGHTAETALGRSIDLLGVPGPDNCTGRIRYALDTQREMDTFTGKLRHADGRAMDVEVRPRPVRSVDGRPGLILTVVDRSREAVMSDVLARQAEQQDRLIQNLDQVLYSVAVPSMETLTLSRTAEALTGHDIEDLQDFRRFLELAHPDDREEVLRRWEHARSGEKSTLRWRLRTAQGNHVWVEDRVVPARDEEGRVVRLDGTVRRIFRQLELERQAQRMMRWLDALEPLTGGGAWAVDMRTGAWQWSSGMQSILGIDGADGSFSDLATRLDPQGVQVVRQLLDEPDHLHPIKLSLHGPAAGMFILEPWLQRGADGEPIWLYGIMRPGAPRRRRDIQATLGTLEGALTLPPSEMPPEAVTAPMTAEAVAVSKPSVAEEALQTTVPFATGTGAATDEAERIAAQWATDATRRAVDAVLAAEQLAAQQALARVRQEAAQLHQEAQAEAALAKAQAAKQLEDARARAAAESLHAKQADQERLAAQREMEQALAAAETARQQAIEEAQQARARAEEEAAKARKVAEAEAARAKQAEEARQAAEEARRSALQAADEVKRQALAEAQAARAEALRHAEEAQQRARAEAARAQAAEQARLQAEAARQQAIQAAQKAQATAQREAGESRAQAVRAEAEAKKLAEAEAAKARQAEEARIVAERARQEALDAMERAKAQALQQAAQARDEALAVAAEAQQRAQAEAAEAKRAHAALQAAEQARAKALREAESAKAHALKEADAAKQAALAEAQKATDEAVAQAQRAVAAARAEAAKAEKAEKARAAAEQAVAEAARRADETAAQAQAEAQRVRDEALREAEQARAAARAEAIKAEQAEKALQRTVQEVRREREQAVRAAEAAHDEVVERLRQEHELLQQQLAEAHARAEAAEAEMQRAWAEERMRVDEPQQVGALRPAPAFDNVPEPVPRVAGAIHSPWGQEPEEESAPIDVVWDDEIGWVPQPRGRDKAEQLKAKSWQGEGSPKAKGPWALD